MHHTLNNVGAGLRAKVVDYISATAASTGDNTKATGDEVDRLVSGKGMAKSAKLIIQHNTTLTTDKTLSFTVGLTSCETSGGSYSAATSLLAKTVEATATGLGVVEIDVDLAAYGRYLKFEITPDLSADNTDTSIIQAAVVLGGFQTIPATATV